MPKTPTKKCYLIPSPTSTVQSSQLRQNGVEEFHYPSAKENQIISRRTIIWSPYVEKVLLVKGKEGLGFSIFECKAFSDHNAIAIVVYSVICNSAADRSGQLFPGDRLMSINSFSMTNVRLKEAIGILKSVPEGPVVLEISKPLSLSSEEFANVQDVQMDYYEPAEEEGSDERTDGSLWGKKRVTLSGRMAELRLLLTPVVMELTADVETFGEPAGDKDQFSEIKQVFYIQHNPTFNKDEGFTANKPWLTAGQLSKCFHIGSQVHHERRQKQK
ncbi:PDZ domain containing protein [Trichuris trichiura]|uniref:PDZ domain containing protein n=1 Tax=Trichuris trichiura TaxID=36087 RepID=A0A077Z462_TRITR|nr:PDZ domain containing protein [Trichuris trichiura]